MANQRILKLRCFAKKVFGISYLENPITMTYIYLPKKNQFLITRNFKDTLFCQKKMGVGSKYRTRYVHYLGYRTIWWSETFKNEKSTLNLSRNGSNSKSQNFELHWFAMKEPLYTKSGNNTFKVSLWQFEPELCDTFCKLIFVSTFALFSPFCNHFF